MVVGVATCVILLGFLSLVRENTTENIGYKISDVSVVILGLCLNIYLFSPKG
jgi:hypothetical protein